MAAVSLTTPSQTNADEATPMDTFESGSGSSSGTQHVALASLSASREWTPHDFAGFFPPQPKGREEKAGGKAAGGDSYDSTMTDFEAEAATEKVERAQAALDTDAWEALLEVVAECGNPSNAAEDAGHRLIRNHAAVLADITNPSPTTQVLRSA